MRYVLWKCLEHRAGFHNQKLLHRIACLFLCHDNNVTWYDVISSNFKRENNGVRVHFRVSGNGVRVIELY